MNSNVTELPAVEPAVFISLASVLIVTTAITIVGNIMIIFIIFRTPSFQNPVYIMTASISMVDLLYIVAVFPQYVVALITRSNLPPFGTALCYVQVYLSNGTIATTIYLMAATAVCRTLHVCYANIYSKLCNTKMILISLSVFWTVPFILCAVSDKGIKYDKTKFICVFVSPTYLYVLGGLVYLPSFVIMLAAYIQILRFVRQSRRRVEANVAVGAIQIQKDKHVFKLVVAVVLVFVLSNVVPSAFYTVSYWYSKHITDLIGSWLGRVRPIANFVGILITCTYMREIMWNNIWFCQKR